MVRYLIPGGAGFIGSNLVHRLHRDGHEVHVVDDLLTGQEANLPDGVSFHRVDASDPEAMAPLADEDWDRIVHLAGASSAPLFDEDPMRASQAVRAFQNSMELAKASGAKVGFASTSSFYSRCEKPYREDMHVVPGTLYEFSKIAMEQMAHAYHMSDGVDTVALRFFSVYGPQERGKGNLANIVSQFQWCLQAGVPPVIYGDGSQTRDFTYVDDLLDGLLLALEHSEGMQVYNIGTGVEHDFNDVVALLNEAMGTDIEPRYVPNPVKNYVQETLADNSKLRALGWEPKVDLRTGIERLVAMQEPVDDALLQRVVPDLATKDA